MRVVGVVLLGKLRKDREITHCYMLRQSSSIEMPAPKVAFTVRYSTVPDTKTL